MYCHILKTEFGRADKKITSQACSMIAQSLERQMLDNAVVANQLALSNNIITVGEKHARMSAQIVGRPASNWTRTDMELCDELIGKS